MMTTTTTFRVHALPAEVLDAARREHGTAAVERMPAGGGEPLRCCLRDAAPGEALILFNYAPPLPSSPYQEAGAVFAHAQACGQEYDAHAYPAQWYGRAQVLRAYDARGWIHPTTRVHDGTAPEAAIAAILADPDVVQIHSRNVAYGCYMFTVTRD